MNKIISMSVWGNDPRYIIGAKRQVELAKKYYSEWEVRIYTDNPDKFINTEAVIIPVKENTSGYFWRFEPLFESENNIVLVRDSDGRITIRERRATREWEESDKQFHIFRDHEAHFEFPIIACAFGNKGKLSNVLYEKMNWFKNNTSYYTNDQVFLKDYVYDEIKNNVMIHSMNDIGWFKNSRELLCNPYSFCGNGFDENDMPLYPNTLKECKNFNRFSLDVKYKFDEGILNY